MPRLETTHILQSLAELRNLPTTAFGSEAHEFGLNPPLSEDEVLAFERAYGVVLPSDYREFLLKIGNGGAGPFYGVFPLGFVDSSFDITPWQKNDGLVGDLSESFPFHEEWNDLTGKPGNELRNSATGPDEADYHRRWEAFEGVYCRSELVNGAIPICHMGCALRVYLVITGPEAGYLWEDRRVEYAGIKPLKLRDGSKARLAGWYDEWLDDCLSAVCKPK